MILILNFTFVDIFLITII